MNLIAAFERYNLIDILNRSSIFYDPILEHLCISVKSLEYLYKILKQSRLIHKWSLVGKLSYKLKWHKQICIKRIVVRL